jgi:choline dehydrogenase-like flavoprotein
MKGKSGPGKASAEQALKDIRAPDAPAAFGGREDPYRAGRAARRGEHLRAVPPRRHCRLDVLRLVEGSLRLESGAWRVTQPAPPRPARSRIFAWKTYRKREVMPGDLKGKDMVNFLRNASGTYFHQSCTCRMGRDEFSVVDSHLKVYGIDGLRIADPQSCLKLPPATRWRRQLSSASGPPK